MIPATEGVLRLQMKSKSSMPCTALVCRPYTKHLVLGWKRVCCGVGLSALLGAAKRAMLSLGWLPLVPLAEVEAWEGCEGLETGMMCGREAQSTRKSAERNEGRGQQKSRGGEQEQTIDEELGAAGAAGDDGAERVEEGGGRAKFSCAGA